MSGIVIAENLKGLGAIGFQPSAGTTRMAYSPEYEEGRDYVKKLMEDAGLEVSLDSVGNLSGVLRGKTDKRIATGSHIDTVPGAGMYDGTLGVIAAIQCVKELRSNGYENEHSIEVIAFTEEEGNVIGGTFGSKCFTGQRIEPAELEKMKAYGLTEESVKAARRNEEDYRCYLEYHIEQGGVLESENKTIGIVEGIVGIIRFRATVKGTANHAGTTPMHLRNDAVVKACGIISDLISYVSDHYRDMVCTVGDVWVPRGAANVVPGECGFLIELRYRSLEPMYEAIKYIREKYDESNLTLEQILEQKETVMSCSIAGLAEDICREKQYSYKRMFSGAGHDAMNMAYFTPCGMIFIQSAGGISHNPKEFSSPEDIEKGKEVLKEMIVNLDREGRAADENADKEWDSRYGL